MYLDMRTYLFPLLNPDFAGDPNDSGFRDSATSNKVVLLSRYLPADIIYIGINLST